MTAPNSQPPPSLSSENKSQKKPSHPHHPWSDYLPLATIVLTLIWITQLLLVQIVGNTTNRQLTDAAILQQQLTDQQRAASALSQHQAQIDQLPKSFPTEDGIIEFITQIKTQTADFPETKIQISNSQPIKTKELIAPFLPVAVSLTATPSAMIRVLEYLNQTHYLLQPSVLEITAVSGLTEPAKLDFKGNLYVSNELIQ